MKKFSYALGLLAALCLPSAEAVNREIRALFQPDPAQPSKNVFINQTPNSGYCAYFPGQCAANNMFSIQIPVRSESGRPIVPGDGMALKVPANWRPLTVINQVTQESETVEVLIVGIGSKYLLSKTVSELTGEADYIDGHRKLWSNSSWVYAPAPCQYSGVGSLGADWYAFFWKAPVESCTKFAAFAIPQLAFEYIDFAYELRTPNPLGMSTGLYTGSLSYSIGPAGDFQLGPMMQPDDGNLTLDFVLDVQHTLKIDMPPGGNKVVLEPAGGWRHWIDSGRKPTEIYRDQTFFISASSRFKVMMYCRSLGGSRCDIGSTTGRTTQVEVRLSLPTDIEGPGGGPFLSGRLEHNRWVGPFQPGRYVDRKPGKLRFEIPKDAIDFLLRPGVTDTLKGYITIIWDSEV